MNWLALLTLPLLLRPLVSDREKVNYFKTQNALAAETPIFMKAQQSFQRAAQVIGSKCSPPWEPQIIDGEPQCMLKAKPKK